MGDESMRTKSMIATIACGLVCGAALRMVHADDRKPVKSALPKDRVCDRACLYGFLDRYLAALADKDPARLPWSKSARTSENNVELMIGDGLWGTISGLGDYRLRFADPTSGEVVFFGAATETGAVSPFVVRLKIEDGRIAESETLVRRKADEGNVMAEPKFQDKPILNEIIPEPDRLPRERLISIADGYFDTLQLNDGTLFTQFDDNCNRVENGVQTTNNPDLAKLSFSLTLGCAEQFKLGNFLFDDRLRARRYPLVDVERGLVLGATFIDHSGRLGTYQLTDGRVQESRYRRPHSYYLLELFKITKEGRIRQIEAVFMTVPYRMPSPWE
jgi:hypothetical protein